MNVAYIPLLVALIGLCAAFVVAAPGYLAWRTAMTNGRKADAAAALIARQQKEAADAAQVVADKAQESARIAALVKDTLDGLGLSVDALARRSTGVSVSSSRKPNS